MSETQKDSGMTPASRASMRFETPAADAAVDAFEAFLDGKDKSRFFDRGRN